MTALNSQSDALLPAEEKSLIMVSDSGKASSVLILS